MGSNAGGVFSVCEEERSEFSDELDASGFCDSVDRSRCVWRHVEVVDGVISSSRSGVDRALIMSDCAVLGPGSRICESVWVAQVCSGLSCEATLLLSARRLQISGPK